MSPWSAPLYAVLEGLLDKVAVTIHPGPQQPAHAYAGVDPA